MSEVETMGNENKPKVPVAHVGTPVTSTQILDGVAYQEQIRAEWDSRETLNLGKFITKDSGKRVEFESGMRRDTQEGKPRYDLIELDFLKRWAELMSRGAEKYGENNWRKANSEEELQRFRASGFRHFIQWLNGETDEDHGAAVAFNIAAADYIKRKLK